MIFDAQGRQSAGNTEDEREVVHHDHHHVHRELRPHRSVRAEVQNAVEQVAQRERACVGHRHRDRKRRAQPTVQQREERQIDCEREAVEHDEAQKCGRHNGIQPERQPGDDNLAKPVEALKRRWGRLGLHAHVATLTWPGG